MTVIKLVPDEWVNTDAYAVGDIVQYNGIRFECIIAVDSNVNGNLIPVDNTSWEFKGTLRITDYYSLQYAIAEAINTTDVIVNNSIPLYVQNIERKLGKLLRSPAQIIKRRFTIDTDSKISIPDSLLEIIHVRVDSESSGRTIIDQGSVSIQKMDRTSWEELRQQFNNTGYNFGALPAVDFPGYYLDDEYFYFAPDLDDGTTIELTYYQEVPELGSSVTIVNDDYEAVNSDGQTLAQWIADGNDAADFVADVENVLSNLWTATTPHLLKAGASLEASSYLKDEAAIQMWTGQYAELLLSTELEFKKLQASGSVFTQQSSPYAMG